MGNLPFVNSWHGVPIAVSTLDARLTGVPNKPSAHGKSYFNWYRCVPKMRHIPYHCHVNDQKSRMSHETSWYFWYPIFSDKAHSISISWPWCHCFPTTRARSIWEYILAESLPAVLLLLSFFKFPSLIAQASWPGNEEINRHAKTRGGLPMGIILPLHEIWTCHGSSAPLPLLWFASLRCHPPSCSLQGATSLIFYPNST